MLLGILGVTEDEWGDSSGAGSISCMIARLHEKEDLFSTISSEELKSFLKNCNCVLKLIERWNEADQDYSTFIEDVRCLMKIANFYEEGKPVAEIWQRSFCENGVGWHLRSNPAS